MSSANIFERNGRRRVVVTGVGALTPSGNTLTESWDSLVRGESAIKKITAFDVENYDVQIAGEVKGFDASKYIEKKELKKMGRFIHFTMATATMAVEDSGLNFQENEELRKTTGALIGVGMGGLEILEKQIQTLTAKGPKRVSPFFIPSVITNLASGHVSIRFGLQGPNFSVTSACASGCHSIGEAARMIQMGEARVMIAGGSESAVCASGIAGFSSMRALSARNHHPEAASRPWDKERDGFVLAEGSASFILEDFEHAKHRGAEIYGELLGYGSSSDAYHITKPSEGGQGAALAITNCLQQAQVPSESIDYINAHGTSTPAGDVIECQAIEKALGTEQAKKVWISSTKSMTGHGLGAAGAMESAFSLMTLKTNTAPPTINLDNPSEDCYLDFVPHSAREKNMKYVLNNSFGFGGTNATLLFAKV